MQKTNRAPPITPRCNIARPPPRYNPQKSHELLAFAILRLATKMTGTKVLTGLGQGSAAPRNGRLPHAKLEVPVWHRFSVERPMPQQSVGFASAVVHQL